MTAVLLCCGALSLYAHDRIPSPPQTAPVALVGATVHTVSGEDIENATVLFEDGVITAVGGNVALPAGVQKIDVSGKHVYPGLIEALSQLGLTEISAVRQMSDYRETGDINPNVRAETAVNADSERIPVTRSNGIAIAGTLPSGSLVAGMAAALMLDGWSWGEMTLKAPLGLVIEWPGTTVTPAYGAQKSGDSRRKNVKARIMQLDKTFSEARAYMTAREAAPGKDVPVPNTDVRWESMIPVLKKEIPVWIHADRKSEIEDAVAFAVRNDVRMVLIGGFDAPSCATLLNEHDISVIASPVCRLPLRRDSAYDSSFTLPERLRENGVKFCISGHEGHGNERNLPYHAAMAASYGLPQDEALKAITLHAAEVLGIGDRAGSIEKGRDATIIVTDGDILEITTQVERMFIMGRPVDLGNKQTALYEKYREKYRQHDARN